VARSFARIHRTNLIAQAIPPLVLDGEPRIEQGDEWRVDGLAEAVRSGGREVVAATPHGEVRLGLELSARERAILLGGGLVAHARRELAAAGR
jgi:aconitate hydratase